MHVIIPLQFSFFEYIEYMSADIRLLSVKKKCHLVYIQPYGLVLQADINLCLPVVGLVYNYLVFCIHRLMFLYLCRRDRISSAPRVVCFCRF